MILKLLHFDTFLKVKIVKCYILIVLKRKKSKGFKKEFLREDLIEKPNKKSPGCNPAAFFVRFL